VVRHFCGVPNVIEQMTTRLSLPTVPHETVQGCALTVTGWINDRPRTYEPSSLAMSAVQRASEEPTVCTASKTDGEIQLCPLMGTIHMGQQRSSNDVCVTSAITPIAARKRTVRDFADVPNCDIPSCALTTTRQPISASRSSPDVARYLLIVVSFHCGSPVLTW
jgi:hypothetical protein